MFDRLKIKAKYIAIFYFYFLAGIPSIFAQLCNPIDTFIYLADNQVNLIQITVDNVLNNDLSDANQGICGIQLIFKHSQVGDLTVTLTSPAGQEITLIGPFIVNFPTAFTNWDVFFTSCGFPAAPDPGFPEIWSNEAPWAALGNYTGIYYPYQGCLEDFNLGPVNGTWTLSFTDNILFDDGQLLGVNLIFCDPSGIDCSLCSADAGSFQEDSLEFCAGDPALRIASPQIIYDTLPDFSNYGYSYLTIFNDTILKIGNDIELTAAEPGIYQICGLSYNKNDSSYIQQFPVNFSYSDFIDSLTLYNSTFCSDLTDTCLSITIHPVGEKIDTIAFICPGDTLNFEGAQFSEAGDYFLVDNSDSICGKTIDLHINYYDLQSFIEADSIELSCGYNQIELRAVTASIVEGVNFSWATVNGKFLGPTDQLNTLVIHPGIYYFILEKESCFDTSSIIITSDGSLTDYFVMGGTIDCNSDSIMLDLTPLGPFTSILWTGPDNTQYPEEDPIVTLPGLYYFELTGENGCVSLGSAEVTLDTIKPAASLQVDTLNCIDTLLQINFESENEINTVFWPELNVTVEDPYVSVPGIYHLFFSGPNGCVSNDSILVHADIHRPDIDVIFGTLSCADTSVLIDVSYTDDSLIFDWINPANDHFDTEDLLVNQGGIYQLSVQNAYGCSLDTSILIIESFSGPNFVMPDSIVLPCAEDSVQLQVFFIDAMKSVSWSGPGTFQSNTPEPYVQLIGSYYISVTGENDCISTDSIFVVEQAGQEEFALSIDTIDCQQSTGSLQFDFSGNLSFDWLDESGNVYSGSNLNLLNSGLYFLTITDNDSQCTNEYVVELPADTLAPVLTIEVPDTISCVNPVVNVNLISNIKLIGVDWTGQGIDKHTQNITVDSSGWYYVVATAKNNCVSMDSVEIIAEGSFILNPSIFYFPCLTDSIQIYIPEVEAETYTWSLNGSVFSNASSPYVAGPGDYKVVVTTQGGCMDSTIVHVENDQNLPLIQIPENGELNCIDSFVLLEADVLSAVSFYQWNGPGVNSQSLIDTARFAGIYYFTVTGTNNCTLIDSVEVISSMLYPTIEAVGDSLNCYNASEDFTINAIIETDYSYINWDGPNFYNSSSPFNTVSDTGTYTLTVEGSKGCFSYDTTQVVIDTLKPDLTIIQTDTLSCFNDSIIIRVESNVALNTVKWTGPNGFEADSKQISISIAGNYRVTAEGENACINSTMIEVTENKIKPYLDISGEVLTCSRNKIPLSLNTNIDNFFIEWFGPDNYIYTGFDPIIKDTGWYYAIITDLDNGCQNMDSLQITEDKAKPILQTGDFHLSCTGDSIEIYAQSIPADVQFLWTGPGNYSYLGEKATIINAGIYMVTVIRSDNGCSARDSVIVLADPEYPDFVIITNNLNCIDDSVQLFISGVSADDSLFWSGPDSFESFEFNPYIYAPGVYTLSVTGENGCTVDTTVLIERDTITPEISIAYDDFLLCEKNTATLNGGGSSSGANFLYEWSSLSGKILQGKNSLYPTIEGPGFYVLSILNTENNCSIFDSIQVEEKESSLDSIDLLITNPRCFGYSDGRIEITGVYQGYPPLRYSLDGGTYSSINIFNNKPAGNYVLSIRDAYGCFFDTLVTIDQGSDIQLILTADKETVYLGESVTITGNLYASNPLSLIEWQPTNLITFNDSLSNTVSLTETTVFSLFVEDIYGCTAEDLITIYVSEKINVFIPNIFSPNGDDINDRFYALGGNGVDRILEFEIYDRWGNKVHHVSNISLNDYNFGWDGTFNGKKMVPGVYVYRFSLLSTSGQIVNLTGDITLIW